MQTKVRRASLTAVESGKTSARRLLRGLPSLADRKTRTLGGSSVPMGLGDFFFSPDDPLHPDLHDEEDDDEDDV